jgi:protein SCO1/2
MDKQCKVQSSGFKVRSLAVVFFAACCCWAVQAQFGNFREGAPLYGPRPPLGQAPTTSGLPKPLQEAKIEQNLNAQMPLDAQFKDETGRDVQLKEYFGQRPVVLALIYYNCPMLCSQVLNGMTAAMKQDNFNAGSEFEVVVISFDARETPALAAQKKAAYLDRYGRPNTAHGWHFLTGDQANIDKVTQTVGFKYYWDHETNQFAHASAIMVSTAEGRLSHYIYGIEYARDLHLALVDAGGGKIGSKAEQLLLYCYHYDPARGKYGFAIMNVLRAAGVLTVAGVIALIFGLRRRREAETRP